MDCGKLNKRITLQIASITRDTYGSEIKTFTDTPLWADVKYKGLRQSTEDKIDFRAVTFHFTIRSKTIDIDSTRIKYNNQYFKVLTTIDNKDGFITLVGQGVDIGKDLTG